MCKAREGVSALGVLGITILFLVAMLALVTGANAIAVLVAGGSFDGLWDSSLDDFGYAVLLGSPAVSLMGVRSGRRCCA